MMSIKFFLVVQGRADVPIVATRTPIRVARRVAEPTIKAPGALTRRIVRQIALLAKARAQFTTREIHPTLLSAAAGRQPQAYRRVHP